MDNIKKIYSSNQKIVLYIGLLLFSLWAIFIRFYRITEVGLEGDDVFWYWDKVNHWVNGDYVLGAGYRPAVHATYLLAMKIFGINDYAIKVMNSLLNLSSGVLIYFCAMATIKNRFISILTSFIYLSLPFVIEESRQELSHIASTFYYLLSYQFFTKYYFLNYAQKNIYKYFYLSLSGIFLGIASHVHPDLATLGLPYFLFIIYIIFLETKGSEKFNENFKKRVIRETSLFSFSYFFTYIFSISSFGIISVYKSLFSSFKLQNNQLVQKSLIERMARYLYGTEAYIRGSFSRFGSILLAISIVNIFYIKIKKIKLNPIVYLPLFLSFFHIFTCLFTVQRRYILRLLHPSTPFLILCMLFGLNFLLENFNIKRSKLFLVITSVVLLYSSHFHLYNSELYTTKIYKSVYSQTSALVSSDKKILITPSLFHWYRKGFKSDLYFGKNAVYLSQYRHGVWKFEKSVEENFKKIILTNKIKYILIAKNDRNIRKKLVGHHDAGMFFKSIYNLSQQEYSLAKEYKILKVTLEKLKAIKIKTHEKFDVFQLP
jgi:hypothetical protein